MNDISPVFFYVAGSVFCYIFAAFVYVLYIVAAPLVGFLEAQRSLVAEETKYVILSTCQLYNEIMTRQSEEDDDSDDDDTGENWDTYSDGDDDASERWKNR